MKRFFKAVLTDVFRVLFAVLLTPFLWIGFCAAIVWFGLCVGWQSGMKLIDVLREEAKEERRNDSLHP